MLAEMVPFDRAPFVLQHHEVMPVAPRAGQADVVQFIQLGNRHVHQNGALIPVIKMAHTISLSRPLACAVTPVTSDSTSTSWGLSTSNTAETRDSLTGMTSSKAR